MRWLHKITAGLGRKSPWNGAPDGPGPTPANQWTVPGICFYTTGWQLTASSLTSMTWTARDATLVLTKDHVPPDHAPATLTADWISCSLLAELEGQALQD
jgi:hypothetical protein